MQATHPDHLRQLVDARRRALREEAAGDRLVRHRRAAGRRLRPALGASVMTARIIVIARWLRQSAWRTSPTTRGETP